MNRAVQRPVPARPLPASPARAVALVLLLFGLASPLHAGALAPRPGTAQRPAGATQDTPAEAVDTPRADTAAQAARPVQGVPVVLRGDTLRVLTEPLGPLSPRDRAELFLERVRQAARRRGGPDEPGTLEVTEGPLGSDLRLGDIVITTVTDADAAALGVEREALARELALRLSDALDAESWTSVVRAVATGILLTLLAAAVFWALIRALRTIFTKAERLLRFWRNTRVPALRIQKLEIVSASRLTDVLVWLAKVTHVVLVLLLIYFFLPLVFSFFPWTQELADRLLDYVVQPFGRAFRGIIAYLPNLATIAVVVVITRYLLVLIHAVFYGIERSAISFPGFFPEWAEPTYKIVRFLVLVFALILIWDKLPGSDSEAFEGVSIFVGLLVSFGSASAIANIVAGVVITYMRPFRLGDRVKIADTVGDVVEKSLLVTRIRTIKNVDITVPNAMVLGAHIVNYSSSAADRGVVMHTSVTIGYDVPWRDVHAALIQAARDTASILDDPEPFVLQTALGDFAVAYELNAYTAEPNRMAAIYSELHQNVQDRFNEAGIEIMSPTYTAVRDGNRIAIPDDHVPRDYEQPGFRVLPVNPLDPST